MPDNLQELIDQSKKQTDALGVQIKALGQEGVLAKKLDVLTSVDTKVGELKQVVLAFGAADNNENGPVAALHEQLKKLGYVIPLWERQKNIYGAGTQSALLHFQKKQRLVRSGNLDQATKIALDSAAAATSRLQGRVVLNNKRPAKRLIKLRLYRQAFGGVKERIAETESDEQGFYAFPMDTPQAAKMEVRAVIAGDQEVTLTAASFTAGKQKRLNLVLPASVGLPVSTQPAKPEFDQLKADVELHLPDNDFTKLGGAQENENVHDLTFLHGVTGWDARLLALAATAVKRSGEIAQETGCQLEPALLYALFRVGLPSDRQLLARVSVATVENALSKAKKAAIFDYNEEEIKAAIQTFAEFALTTRLTAKSPGVLASLRDQLARIGLTTTEQQKTFGRIYYSHHSSSQAFWDKVGADLPGMTNALKLHGRLSPLTFNNPDLTADLQQTTGSADNLVNTLVGNPAQRDSWHDQPEAWVKRLHTLAESSGKPLDELIPGVFSGADTHARLNGYANALARQVRLGFPTQIVARKLNSGELKFPDQQALLQDPVTIILNNASNAGFKLGRTPVDSFIRTNQEKIFADLDTAEKKEAAVKGLKLLARLYQITPSDDALQRALQAGLTSANDVVSFTRDEFVKRFGTHFASPAEAGLIYRKAQQVSTVTLNLFTAASQLDSTPPVAVFSPSPQDLSKTKQSLIEHFPTLESLFGSLDFCECEHCRSVLSPAAYLVDLLKFLDTDDTKWAKYVEQWQIDHPGAQPPEKPYDVLIKYRPDLAHLSLTCENTNTTLPYIDLVNEILEYYVAYNKLDAKTAHDTGAATTDELLAEPQNIVPAAYDQLKKARYPLTLPFDLWSETLRQFLGYFETPLWQLLETLRTTDEPFVNTGYGRADIFVESLGLTPSEYAIFSDVKPLTKWHELYGYASEAIALHGQKDNDGNYTIRPLTSAKTLARCLGVSYKELVDVVCTGFVNPNLEQLVILHKLNIDATDLFRYKQSQCTDEERNAMVNRLTELTNKYQDIGFNASQWLSNTWNTSHFANILVLKDPNAGCNFDETVLTYISGEGDAKALDFLKLNFFVRLWKRLGWSMAETDRLLQTFIPSALTPLTGDNIGQALKTALIYAAHLKKLDKPLALGKASCQKLLTLWDDLPTTGKNPLYAQLFLNHSVLKDDPVFDHPLGNYLCYPHPSTDQYVPFCWDATQPEDVKQGNVALKNHLLALQGALKLTADEMKWILTDTGQSLDSAPLTLANVSLLYRYGLLAKALKLSISDLIALKELSALDPFKALAAAPLESMAQDYPFTQTLNFVELVARVKNSKFTIEELNYLLRHRFDPVGMHRSADDAPLALIKLLASEIARMETEQRLLSKQPPTFQPLGVDSKDFDKQLYTKLRLLLPPDVLERFMGFWQETIEFEASESHVPDYEALPATSYDVAQFGLKVQSHPEFSPGPTPSHLIRQSVIHTGVLTSREKNLIVAQVSAPSSNAPQYKKDAHARFLKLLDEIEKQSQEQARKFFSIKLAGFLTYEDLYDERIMEKPAEKRKVVLKALETLERLNRKRQLIVQSLTTYTGTDPTLLTTLLTDHRLLTDPSKLDAPLLNAFADADQHGADVSFFAAPNGTGTILETAIGTPVSITSKPKEMLVKPPAAKSVRFEGYLAVPTTGNCRFSAIFEQAGIEAELRFAHLLEPILQGKAAAANQEIAALIELKAGISYHFTFEVHNFDTGNVCLDITAEGLPQGSLDRLMLQPLTSVEHVRRGLLLLTKILQLIEGFALTEREVRYLLTHTEDFGNLDLNMLPTRQADDSTKRAQRLFTQFVRLADYVSLRQRMAGGTDDLIDLFECARRIYPANADPEMAKATVYTGVCQRLADLTRRDVTTVLSCANQLGLTAQSNSIADTILVEVPAFVNELGLQRLWDLLQLVEKLGVPIHALKRWATPQPDSVVASDLKHQLKDRFTAENWQRIAQAIFDKLRQRQRDALVAYILQLCQLERQEQIFERFLIDPGMEPIVQTSRIRLAISSVQTFIQRCLLNLDPRVPPSAIDSKQWEWMKRYRVWDANRKIFLYPENWLEPEFRSDKTHLYQEFESELLQGDVTNALATSALINYLRKLEGMARLEIVTIAREPDQELSNSFVLHVIGRTANTPRKYFYRRLEHNGWTPWEPLPAEIDSAPMVAVVWQQRLHLFWVTFLSKVKPKEEPGMTIAVLAETESASPPETTADIQLHWMEYFQGQWSARQSSSFEPLTEAMIKGTIPADISKLWVRIHATIPAEAPDAGSVEIHLTGPEISCTWRLSNRYDPPRLDACASGTPSWPNRLGVMVNAYQGPWSLKFNPDKEDGTPTKLNLTILDSCNPFSLIFPSVPAVDVEAMKAPFFYQDAENTFYVEPSVLAVPIFFEVAGDPDVGIPGASLEGATDTPIDVPVTTTEPPDDFHDPIDDHWLDPDALYPPGPLDDWIKDLTTVFQYDKGFIGATGWLGWNTVPVSKGLTTRGKVINVNLGSEIAADTIVVATDNQATQVDESMTGAVNIVGGSGVNSAITASLAGQQNVQATYH